MKIKVSIVLLIVLSFFNIGAVSNNHIKSNSFSRLESEYRNKSEFVENGSKIQYKTRNSIDDEKNRIKEYISNNCIGGYAELENNKIKFHNNDMKIESELWNDDIYTYAVITIVNNNTAYETEDLISIFSGLENDELTDIQCYQYYKGRISFNKKDEYTKDISNSIYDAEILSLNNGYTGSGYCTNGEKINFAISNYDTGDYLIIGTPIIFTTY